MTRALPAFFLLFSLVGLANAEATRSASDPEIGRWLTQAAHAVRTDSYRGVMVYLRQGQLDTLRVVHRYSNGIEQERLVALTGQPREVIRHGGRVTSILPQSEVVLITHHQRDGLLADIGNFSAAEMGAHYDLRYLGSRRLADRPSHVISIEPLDEYRYGYRMLIDEKTHLPLKLNLLHEEQVLEQLMFTEIAFPEHIPDEAFEPSYDIDDFQVMKHQTVQVDNPPAVDNQWRPTRLPPGFDLAENGIRQIDDGGVVRQLLFTDGVATVSAFIAPAGMRKPLNGATTMGAVNAYGRAAGDYHITVVGEVPAVTVRLIAENIVHKGDRASVSPD